MNTHNQFSQYRKKHHLLLSDIALVLDLDVGNLSRQECGQAMPTTKTILGYHILFNIPLELSSVFKEQSDAIRDRCFQLMEKLESEPPSIKRQYRIQSLDAIITRLMPDLSYAEDEE